jgi:NADH dehydrogenase FAD-containing subunit
VSKYYPELFDDVRIKIIEASDHILGSFNRTLSSYVEKIFKKRNVELLTSTHVAEIKDKVIIVKDGTRIPFGMVVWSTGVKQIPLISKLVQAKQSKNGRLLVDERLRLQSSHGGVIDSVYAVGDCAANETKPLPQLAQVASQQGSFLAKHFNGKIASDAPFKYQHLVRF